MIVAAAALGVALAGFAWRLTWATPPSGFVGTPLAGPIVMDEIDVKYETDEHEIEIKTKGLSDAYAVHNRYAPGGQTGWHSHPGVFFVLITKGVASDYSADDPTHTPQVYRAGTGFVEEGGYVHNLRNEGDEDLELVAFFLVPFGAPRRIDQPQPPDYPF